MEDLREAVEQLIEEQYLAGLSENEIRENFERFAEICAGVVKAHVERRDQAERLLSHLAQMRTRAFTRALTGLEDGPAPRTERERLVTIVARQKRRMLHAVEACDPTLVPVIQVARFKRVPIQVEPRPEAASGPPRAAEARRLKVAVGLILAGAALLAMQLFLFL